ncbi:hypothetical protein [Streptomyces sp. NPDC005507]|uniref:hypothetical protein n=1 Tax=Streptomyces sp. NPDC005507 TaxID=3154885 RepID=UPI0033B6B26C
MSEAVPYLLLIDYAAPRFLLPVYALPAIAVADALATVSRYVRPRLRPATLASVAALVAVQLVSQHAIMTRAAPRRADRRRRHRRLQPHRRRPADRRGTAPLPGHRPTGHSRRLPGALRLRADHRT